MNESIIKAFEDREGEECSRVIVPQPDVLHIELLRNLPDGIYGLVISFVSNKFHKIFIVKKKEGADEYLGEVQLDEVRAIIINTKKGILDRLEIAQMIFGSCSESDCEFCRCSESIDFDQIITEFKSKFSL